MRRDLKAACVKPSSYDIKSQQRKLNSFVKIIITYANMKPWIRTHLRAFINDKKNEKLNQKLDVIDNKIRVKLSILSCINF
jgi:hypothetical protein